MPNVNPQLVAAFVLAATVLIVVPGPNLMFIAGASLGRGRRAGIAAAIGVELGTLAHGALAAVGLAALMASHPVALTVLRLAGAAYLLFLGLRTLLTDEGDGHAVPKPRSGSGMSVPSARVAFAREVASGFTVNILNPKVILFFLAFVPQFLDPDGALAAWGQVILLTAIMVGIGLTQSAVWVFVIATAVGTRTGARTRWVQRYGVGSLYVVLAVVAAVVNV